MNRSSAGPAAAGSTVEDLSGWLAGLAGEPRSLVLLGGTGHLDLGPEDEARIVRELQDRVLPDLVGPAPHAQFAILTGLAPGADLVIAETVVRWLQLRRRACRQIGLLPVPSEVLWADWTARAGASAVGSAAVRQRFEARLRACDTVVQLWNAARPPDWADVSVRQSQYRRLGAVLVEQCEVLVAVLRAGRAAQPGGTAEVVAWRGDRSLIPAALASGARRHRSGWMGPDRLVVIDPDAPGPAAGEPEHLRKAREALRAGNSLLSYDRIVKAEEQGHASDELEYVKLQALANAGSTEAALRRFAELPVELRERNEDWLALNGRLHKDLALRGGPQAAEQFRRATECYRAAFLRTGGYFSAINAATMALLGGDEPQSRALARDVLDIVARSEPRGDAEHYYVHATEAEAALLLGDTARARRALTQADARLVDDLNARSRTLRQLRLVCRARRLDASCLEGLRLPPVIYLPPPHRGEVEAAAVPPSAFVYGGVTEPADLAAAEPLVQRNARFHAVLAAPREVMLRHWQSVHGLDWTRRLGRLLEQAHETSVALGFLDREDRWCGTYVSAMALGLSHLTARRLGCPWQALGSTAVSAEAPRGEPITVGAVHFERRFAGVIFADFAGFSRLPDDDLPWFWAQFMSAISERLAEHRGGILLQHTWGDALHVVTGDARTAAEVACEIQHCLEELRPTLPGALASLELRLSAHYAPVFSGYDPVEKTRTYFGTQLSFTARIEPVTPPGMIFVTEAFAAQLTLEAPEAFTLEYAGELTLAKGYGRGRLFSLRPSAP